MDKKLNIITFGSRFYGGQVDRIDDGLKSLGHNVNSFLGPPDLIYSNDPAHFDKAIVKYLNWYSKPKLILNVLDCPAFLPEWNSIHETAVGQLNTAHKVTCISKTVQNDIKGYFNIDAEVIYNPIKPVYYIPNTKRDIKALFVGRAFASNKRVKELIEPLYHFLSPYLGKDWLHFVGSEYPGFGVNEGIVSDVKLNELYNRSLFVLIPSKWEGLNLPLIESIVAGSVPVVCRDMSTALEFAPPMTLCDPTPESISNKMKELASGNIDFTELNEYIDKYSIQFSPKSIANNIINVYNKLSSDIVVYES